MDFNKSPWKPKKPNPRGDCAKLQLLFHPIGF
jgi:hypothetical protein